ncbi:MAG: hypothetical protein E2P02_22085 [Acidobacteria bacterium]|nr:MAG: hypothetical protein E2P02_22085 [Acidobacteriota bacterium]
MTDKQSQTAPNFYAGASRVVLANQTEYDSFAGTGSFAVRADESFLLNAHSGSAGTRSLVILLNWTKELNRLVPMND